MAARIAPRRLAQPPRLNPDGFPSLALGDGSGLELRHAGAMHTTTVYLICIHPGIPREARPGNPSDYLGSTSYAGPSRLPRTSQLPRRI